MHININVLRQKFLLQIQTSNIVNKHNLILTFFMFHVWMITFTFCEGWRSIWRTRRSYYRSWWFHKRICAQPTRCQYAYNLAVQLHISSWNQIFYYLVWISFFCSHPHGKLKMDECLFWDVSVMHFQCR